MATEQWRPITDYGGSYEVSSLGRVKSISRVITFPDGSTRRVKEKIMSPKRNKDGYLSVSLTNSRISKMHYVHRLVAREFILNPGNLPEVNHVSGCKEDNSVENLAWVDRCENMRHAFDTGLCSNKGERHWLAVQVIDNELGQRFSTVKKWCEARGIAYSTGKNILAGKRRSNTIDLARIIRVYKNQTNDNQ